MRYENKKETNKPRVCYAVIWAEAVQYDNIRDIEQAKEKARGLAECYPGRVTLIKRTTEVINY